MSDRIFYVVLFSALFFLVMLAALLSSTGDKKYGECTAKGGVAVRTTTSWVCARLEVIGLTDVKAVTV